MNWNRFISVTEWFGMRFYFIAIHSLALLGIVFYVQIDQGVIFTPEQLERLFPAVTATIAILVVIGAVLEWVIDWVGSVDAPINLSLTDEGRAVLRDSQESD